MRYKANFQHTTSYPRYLLNDNWATLNAYTKKIISKINKKTKAILICNPSNPTGYVYKEKGDYDNAIINFRKAVELNPFKEEYSDEIKTIANIEILKGKEFYDMREYQEAEVHFNKALEYDPENSAAMFRLGNIYLDIKDYVKASEFLEEGLMFQSNNYKVCHYLNLETCFHIYQVQIVLFLYTKIAINNVIFFVSVTNLKFFIFIAFPIKSYNAIWYY